MEVNHSCAGTLWICKTGRIFTKGKGKHKDCCQSLQKSTFQENWDGDGEGSRCIGNIGTSSYRQVLRIYQKTRLNLYLFMLYLTWEHPYIVKFYGFTKKIQVKFVTMLYLTQKPALPLDQKSSLPFYGSVDLVFFLHYFQHIE